VLVPCFTPVRSPPSNGVAEAFVKTFKRDCVYVHDRPDAQTVLSQSRIRVLIRNAAFLPGLALIASDVIRMAGQGRSPQTGGRFRGAEDAESRVPQNHGPTFPAARKRIELNLRSGDTAR
jgi:transposase InsO family protein